MKFGLKLTEIWWMRDGDDDDDDNYLDRYVFGHDIKMGQR